MKEIKLCIVLLVVVMISSVPTTANLYDTINQIKGNILQRKFCTEILSGGDKYACRIRNFEKFGFLFCKSYGSGENTCEKIIKREILGFTKLQNNVKTVTVDLHHIFTHVECPDSKYHDTRCSGFLEKWVDKANGIAFHLRVYIDDHEVPARTSEIIQHTTKTGLSTTRGDLEKIYWYMWNDGVNFRCICDLQGFYLRGGGFLVGDTEGIKENLRIEDACKKDDPTTGKFLKALAYMINEIKSVEAINKVL